MTWWMWLIVVVVVFGMFGNAKESTKREEAETEAVKRRKEAEDYIMNSGDKEAITALKLAQANPANYTQSLAKSMNSGNDTLKTALGVMTGVVAGNMISNAITTAAISNALEDMQADLGSSFDSFDGGGFDSDFEV